MCTAIAFCKDNFFFGRTLDAPCDFDCEIISLPRRAPLYLSEKAAEMGHFAVLGMGIFTEDKALFFDAFNEHGLAGAALNFPGKADYLPTGRGGLASYEVISYVLATCKNLWQVKGVLENNEISSLAVSDAMPTTPLHWIFADKTGAVVLEQTDEGRFVYESWCEVLTNSPELWHHERSFLDRISLSPKNPLGSDTEYISVGKGTDGLAGGFSSKERFLRAAYMRRFCRCESSNDFFTVMSSVSIPRGAVICADGRDHYTRYTSCIDAEKLTYSYRTASGGQKSARLTEKLINSKKIERVTTYFI